ncbi:MAG: hypothetical protein ACXWCU_03535 [Caldimonas sp.]
MGEGPKKWKPRLQDDPEYLLGQIEGLQAILFRLGMIRLGKELFMEESLEAIERERSVLLPSSVSDARLAGLDALERSLRSFAE